MQMNRQTLCLHLLAITVRMHAKTPQRSNAPGCCPRLQCGSYPVQAVERVLGLGDVVVHTSVEGCQEPVASTQPLDT